MSVRIEIYSNSQLTYSINLANDTTNLATIFRDMSNYTLKKCELKIFILNTNTMDFHNYVFEYDGLKKPLNFLLNNIMYSLVCDDTDKNTQNMFDLLSNNVYNEILNNDE